VSFSRKPLRAEKLKSKNFIFKGMRG